MRARTLILSLLVTTATAVLPIVSRAAVDVSIGIVVGPPAPLVEVVPAPRPGYVWAPGYWAWDGHRHFWIDGHWAIARPGYRWVPERWVRRGHHWYMERGRWERRHERREREYLHRERERGRH